ncbi:hypothetical protein DFH09DRAFT_1303643 [Mycena vulgaris]|nr:hypothetical protein DFH09DRAFT_1303643 [Mycena vulgaris]
MAAPATRFLRHSTKKTTDIVLEVLRQHKSGLTTKEIYDKAHAMFPQAIESNTPPRKVLSKQWHKTGRTFRPPPEPPHRDHPIRSIHYLKKVVLEELAEERWIVKTIIHPERTEETWTDKPIWRWRLQEEDVHIRHTAANFPMHIPRGLKPLPKRL